MNGRLDIAPRRFLALATILVGLTLAWLLGACASFPETRLVSGTLTKVERDERREAVCGILQRAKDKGACDVPPICCAYYLTLVDSGGHREFFWAFWPRFAEGLKEGEAARFRLHRRPIYNFPCTVYGCTYSIGYAVDGDEDVNP